MKLQQASYRIALHNLMFMYHMTLRVSSVVHGVAELCVIVR